MNKLPANICQSLFVFLIFTSSVFASEDKDKKVPKTLVNVSSKKEQLSEEEKEIRDLYKRFGPSDASIEQRIAKIKEKHALLRFKAKVTNLEDVYKSKKDCLEKQVGLKLIAYYKKEKVAVERLESEFSGSVEYYTNKVVIEILESESILHIHHIRKLESRLNEVAKILNESKVLKPHPLVNRSPVAYDEVNLDYKSRLDVLSFTLQDLKRRQEIIFSEKARKDKVLAEQKLQERKRMEKEFLEKQLEQKRFLKEEFELKKENILSQESFSNPGLMSYCLDLAFNECSSDLNLNWNEIFQTAKKDYDERIKFRKELPEMILRGLGSVANGLGTFAAVISSPVWAPFAYGYHLSSLAVKNKKIYNSHIDEYLDELADSELDKIKAKLIKEIFANEFKFEESDYWWSELVKRTQHLAISKIQEDKERKEEKIYQHKKAKLAQEELEQRRILIKDNEERYARLIDLVKENKNTYVSRHSKDGELYYSILLTLIKQNFKNRFYESSSSDWEKVLLRYAENDANKKYKQTLHDRENSFFNKLKAFYQDIQLSWERAERLQKIIENIGLDELAHDPEVGLRLVAYLSECKRIQERIDWSLRDEAIVNQAELAVYRELEKEAAEQAAHDLKQLQENTEKVKQYERELKSSRHNFNYRCTCESEDMIDRLLFQKKFVERIEKSDSLQEKEAIKQFVTNLLKDRDACKKINFSKLLDQIADFEKREEKALEHQHDLDFLVFLDEVSTRLDLEEELENQDDEQVAAESI